MSDSVKTSVPAKPKRGSRIDPFPELPPDKTLTNSDISGTRQNVPDVKVFGDGDLFQLLSKASSKTERWMKSTKAMEVPGGCVVQVTTQQGDHVAEALTFVPGVKVGTAANGHRKLVRMN